MENHGDPELKQGEGEAGRQHGGQQREPAGEEPCDGESSQSVQRRKLVPGKRGMHWADR